jgi:non-lysosomal glucosylceramidase
MGKYKYLINLCLIICFLISCRQEKEEPAFHNWPVLGTYKQANSGKIVMPVGGIGTGTILMNGNGELINIGIMDCPQEGLSPEDKNSIAPFFAIYTKPDGEEASIRKLQGPSNSDDKERKGTNSLYPEIPLFRKAWFEAAFPFGIVHLRDNKMPVEVNLKTFNPLIPGEASPSSTPMAILIYEVTNTTNSMLEVSVCGAMSNLIGAGCKTISKTRIYISQDTTRSHNRNSYVEFSDVQGIYMVSDRDDLNDPSRGTIALSTAMADSVSYITGSRSGNKEECLTDFWNDFSKDGTLTKVQLPSGGYPLAALAIKQFLSPGETRYFRFFFTWHFPNRWNAGDKNYYAADYTNAWDVTKKITPYLPAFEEQNILFIRLLMDSDIPRSLTEAAINNLSGLKSQMYYRNENGDISGYECLNPAKNSRESNYSAWKYDFAFPFLYGRLSKTMSSGILRHEIDSLAQGTAINNISDEDRFGSIMKFYCDWQLSGDSAFLAENWKYVKRAIMTCLDSGGLDADDDGVSDILKSSASAIKDISKNFRLQFFYLGALKASVAMARQVNDTNFTSRCSALTSGGISWTNDAMSRFPEGNFKINSFTGLFIARISGLEEIINSEILKKALHEIYSDHLTKNVTAPFSAEYYRGDEYAAAALCIYEGLEYEGIKWFEEIRKRYDGKNGNPFNEADDICCETVPLASWAGIIAYTHFNFSAVTRTMTFTSKPGTYFWSDGYSWGSCKISEEKEMKREVEVQVYNGELKLKKFILINFGERELSRKDASIIKSGESFPFTVLRKSPLELESPNR